MKYTPEYCHGCQTCQFRCDHVIDYLDEQGAPAWSVALVAEIERLESEIEKKDKALRTFKDYFSLFAQPTTPGAFASINQYYAELAESALEAPLAN